MHRAQQAVSHPGMQWYGSGVWRPPPWVSERARCPACVGMPLLAPPVRTGGIPPSAGSRSAQSGRSVRRRGLQAASGREALAVHTLQSSKDDRNPYTERQLLGARISLLVHAFGCLLRMRWHLAHVGGVHEGGVHAPDLADMCAPAAGQPLPPSPPPFSEEPSSKSDSSASTPMTSPLFSSPGAGRQASAFGMRGCSGPRHTAGAARVWGEKLPDCA
jgi:hypothetical protein